MEIPIVNSSHLYTYSQTGTTDEKTDVSSQQKPSVTKQQAHSGPQNLSQKLLALKLARENDLRAKEFALVLSMAPSQPRPQNPTIEDFESAVKYIQNVSHAADDWLQKKLEQERLAFEKLGISSSPNPVATDKKDVKEQKEVKLSPEQEELRRDLEEAEEEAARELAVRKEARLKAIALANFGFQVK